MSDDEGGGLTFDQLQSMDVDFGVTQSKAMKEHRGILDEFDRKRRARTLAVPTDDGQVRARLRGLGEPITLFGEGPGDRRERLREIMSRMMGGRDVESEEGSEMSEGESEDSDEAEREEFYTEGSEELYDARKYIAEYSLSKAKKRLEYQAKEIQTPANQRKKIVHECFTHWKVGISTSNRKNALFHGRYC